MFAERLCALNNTTRLTKERDMSWVGLVSGMRGLETHPPGNVRKFKHLDPPVTSQLYVKNLRKY
jgi:hypothetical protein